MADRNVERHIDKIPHIDKTLHAVLLAALNEARDRMKAGKAVVPFTALAIKDNLFIESVNGDTPEDCFNVARHTVQNARGAQAYALCYDGYIDTDAGTQDALIAEGGMPGQDTGYAIAYPYTPVKDAEKETPHIDNDPVYIGTAPNFMIAATPYSKEELQHIDDAAEDASGDSSSENAATEDRAAENSAAQDDSTNNASTENSAAQGDLSDKNAANSGTNPEK